MRNYREYFNEKLEEILAQYNTPVWIAEGMQYACLQGGKRIRPQLLFMSLALLGKEIALGLPFALALEMIHSYSLVHDDLPAMDNDEYRRGQLTTHKKFGEANAILIGDALLTNAFSVMVRGSMGKVSSEKILEIVALFSEYAGVDGMIGGQAMDVAYEGKQISYKTLSFIHEHKTGRLLLLPILVACILGDASLEQRKALEIYGRNIGLAFQIKDDILDVEGDFAQMGKAVKSDEKLQKPTYPSIFGLEKSKEMLAESLREARKALEEVFTEEDLQEFLELTEFMEKRTK
ncbi:MAG: farnesyl diphosphate synthase [Fusobacterium necrophorum]|nr:farnesyl diphosphate synthase [Fusobacterium necrophorum]